ncbi:hypothetical protein LguiA_029010 [Lonicera macranthoides]
MVKLGNQADEEHPSSKYQREQEVKLFSSFGSSDDLYRDIVSPHFQLCQEEISKLAIVKFKELKAESFIQSCSQGVDDMSVLSLHFASSFLGLSTKENKDVELLMYLLASAEKVSQRQYDCASKILNQCDELSSSEGNSVQRLVCYFSVALRDKISRETGIIASKGLGNKELLDFEETVMSPSPTNIAFHQQVPFYQVRQYTGMQVIIESVAEAKKNPYNRPCSDERGALCSSDASTCSSI